MSASPLATLTLELLLLSLVAVGGANAVAPELQRKVVDVHHLMSAAEFADLFAIAQAAPGPNALYASLVGWKVAGIPGALVATLALCGPSCLLAFTVARLHGRLRSPRFRGLSEGLAPVAVGFILATAWVLASSADHSLRAAAVTAATLVLAATTRRNPLWWLGAAGVLGALGLLS